MTLSANIYILECVGEVGWPVFSSSKVFLESEVLKEIFGGEADTLPRMRLYLDKNDIVALRSRGISIEEKPGCHIVLRAAGLIDALPYTVHTNREVTLMEQGKKPLAVFSHWIPEEQDFLDAIIDAFASCSIAEKLIYRWCCWDDGFRGSRPGHSVTIYIARAGEEWRIDAAILLKAVSYYSGWNDGLERMEGFLLGYEAWQNEEYLKAKAEMQSRQ